MIYFYKYIKINIKKLNVLHLFAKNLNNSIIPLINILSTVLYFFMLLMRLGILPTKFSLVPFGIFLHSSCILVQSSSKLVGGLSYAANLVLITAHKFSIGFKSGLCGGHLINWKCWWDKQFWTILAVYSDGHPAGKTVLIQGT